MDEINIRLLRFDEYEREDLVKIFAENGSKMPNPIVATIAIAETVDGKFIGLVTVQPSYHLEPIYVVPEYRNTLVHKKLMEKIIEILKPLVGLQLFVFAPNRKILNLAKRFGFKELDYKVLFQEF